MGQIAGAMERSAKELIRLKESLFWTIAWPSIWVVLFGVTFIRNQPHDVLPVLKGAVTVPMMVFALMIAGMSNLPATVSNDRERGTLAKLMSMPVSPWRDFLGRVLGLLSFSALAVILVALVGYATGARFGLSPADLPIVLGFLVVGFAASAGIGTVIASLITNVQGAIMTGVGLSVITAAMSGVMAPYSSLPAALQAFARIYPISSVNSSIIYILFGVDYAGYKPITIGQVATTIAASVAILTIGIVLYSRVAWRRR